MFEASDAEGPMTIGERDRTQSSWLITNPVLIQVEDEQVVRMEVFDEGDHHCPTTSAPSVS